MAQEQVGSPKKAAWTKIFTAFKVALDLKKMALAAVGILLVFAGWWLLSWIFYSTRTLPEWKDYDVQDRSKAESWVHFKAKRNSWNLLHELAGSPTERKRIDAADVAKSYEEFEVLNTWESGLREKKLKIEEIQASDEAKKNDRLLLLFQTELLKPRSKPTGRLCTPPFSEDRGDNPYLIVARAIKSAGDSSGSSTHVTKWLIHEEAPVVLEPLFKLLMPLVYLFDSRAGGWDRLYLSLAMLWTLAVWGFFGGAICRIAAVQIARNERITLSEALAFTRERFVSYFAAPVFPMVLIAILTLLLIIFGWLEWTPYVGDIFAGLFWPVVLLLGFIMAIVLVGMIGWPLMVATISTEGSDSFDALSRSYSYVYQAPWQFLWYNLLALAYGAVLIFFIGFMASFMVYVGKWGVASAPGLAKIDPKSDREPSYLFNHAPTSFGWRDLLISSSQFVEEVDEVSATGHAIKHKEFTKEYRDSIHGGNEAGAWMVTFWLWIVFLLMLGFGYSYFWSASTIIYFLMRRDVDDTEMDEVHLEDEDMGDPFATPAPTMPSANLTPPTAPTPQPPKPGTISLNVVDAPPSTAITPEPPAKPADPTPPVS